MSNDLKFLNTYTEVMQDNINAVIKQNFIFQTQLKLAEEQLAILEDSKRTADNLSVENKHLQQKIHELTNLTTSYKNVADDKTRLQVSLNETSQVKNQLQSKINDMEQMIMRLENKVKDYDSLKKENTSLKKKLGIEPEKEKKKVDNQAEVVNEPANTF